MKKCIICGSSDDTKMNPLNPESGFYPDCFVHSQCLMTQQYRDWMEKRKSENWQYRRYWDMITVALPVECPQCHQQVGLFPKAVGMGAGNWEINCSNCHNVASRGLCGYTNQRVYSKLEELREDYMMGRLNLINAEIHKLATQYDSQLPEKKCSCGGRFSLAAKPRCIYCDAVLIDSFFHCSGQVVSSSLNK